MKLDSEVRMLTHYLLLFSISKKTMTQSEGGSKKVVPPLLFASVFVSSLSGKFYPTPAITAQ
jgi:hypothetical protein